MALKKKVKVGLAGIAMLLTSLVIVNIVNENLGIQDKVQSCFKRYDKGVVFDTYAVGLSATIGDVSRETIDTNQIACSITRLGFDGNIAAQMASMKQGRLDNDKFAVIWRVTDTVACLDWKKPVKNLFDVDISNNCKVSKVTKSELKVVLKDYR